MTPSTIINDAKSEGVILALSVTGSIKATGDQEHVNKWLPVIREHKISIVALLSEAANDTEHDVDILACFAWLIHFTDRPATTVTFSPEVNHAGALACYPDAVAAEPLQHSPIGGASELSPQRSKTDEAQLRALIEAVYHDNTEPDRHEAFDAELADPDNALTSYTTIAPEYGQALSDTDHRHTCCQCTSHTYSGTCSVARPGGLVSAQHGYRPGAMFQEELHRCIAFKQKGKSYPQ